MTHVEQRLDLRQRILLDLFGQLVVVQTEFGIDEQRHHVAGTREVNAADLARFVDDRSVGRSAAQVERRQRRLGSGSSQRSANRHLGFNAANDGGHTDFVLQLARQALHGKLLRLDHGGQPNRIAHGELAGQGSQNLLRLEGVDGNDVLHADGADRLVRQVSHHLAHLLEHAANIGSSFGVNFFQRTNGRQLRHDGVRAFFDRDLRLLLVTDERDLAGGYAPLFDVTLRGLDDHRAASSHQRARNGHDTLGIFRIEMEQGCDVVGIAKLFDGASGTGDFDRGRHAHRDAIDVLAPRRRWGPAAAAGY